MATDLIELSAVIGDIYDAAIDHTRWQQALASICTFVGGSSAALLWHDSALERSEALHVYNVDPVYLRLYFEKYLPLNPMFPAASFIDVGVVAADEDIMPRSELNRTRFYKEWIKPQGTLGALSVNLEKGVTRTSMINVRMTVPLKADMRHRLELLVPHLQRAIAIGKLFDQSRATAQALTETLDHVDAAVFLVGADGSITFANPYGKMLLSEAVLIQQDQKRLRAIAPGADRLLGDIFAAAEKGDASIGVRGVAVPLTKERHDEWFAHVLPLTSGNRRQTGMEYQAVAAVFIRKTAPNELSPLEELSRRYQLTASEIRVAEAVLRVSGNDAIADTLGISRATVRTHLNRIYRKTGANNQGDLIKLVAGLGP